MINRSTWFKFEVKFKTPQKLSCSQGITQTTTQSTREPKQYISPRTGEVGEADIKNGYGASEMSLINTDLLMFYSTTCKIYPISSTKQQRHKSLVDTANNINTIKN